MFIAINPFFINLYVGDTFKLTDMLKQNGFVQISIEPKEQSRSFIRNWLPDSQIDDYICSAVIQAVKP